MRRTAVFISCITLGTGCPVEKWSLPGGVIDGGRDATGEVSGSGGRTGGPGTGGVPATGGRGGGLGTGGSGPQPCSNRVKLNWEIEKADLVFSVGRNSSMAAKFGDTTRMSAVQQTLRTLVMASQNAVNFGYQDFPSIGSCSNGGCCTNSSPVYPSPGAFGLIDQAMRTCDGLPSMNACVSQSDSRPVGDALRSTINPGPSRVFLPDNMRDRYLVLILDGAPVCDAEDPIQSCQTAQQQVSMLIRANINVYVVPVGDDAEMTACLRTIALQANNGTATVPFTYPARDPAQLMMSMGKIVAKAAAASCVINLLSVPGDPTRVELFIRNHKILPDPSGQNGWSFIPGSPGTIQVHGTSCEELQDVQRTSDIEVWNACAPP